MCDANGKMCCLGFAANQISRISKNAMYMNYEPSQIYEKKSFLVDFISTEDLHHSEIVNNHFTNKAIAINDDIGITDSEREDRLTKLFAKNGIKLEFVD